MKNVLGGSGICDEYSSDLCWVSCIDGSAACVSSFNYTAPQRSGGGFVTGDC